MPGEDLAELRDEVERVSEALGRRLKFLVGKPGLDGHSNGAEQIAVRARDAGMDVVYEGIRLTPVADRHLRRAGGRARDRALDPVGLARRADPRGARGAAPRPAPARSRSWSAGSSPRPTPRRCARPASPPSTRPKDWDLNRMMRDIIALVGERHGADAAACRLDARPRARLGRPPSRCRRPRARRAAARARPERRPGGAEPGREPHRAGPRAGRGAAGRGLPRRARRRGAGPHRRRHRAARRRQVLAALAPGRASGAPAGARSRCSRSTRARGAPAARCSATAPGSSATPLTAGCSSARPPPATRLGGLAPATRAAAGALAAAFDVVVIETVGVGQSETEVADVADTVAVVVQPGSGDVLQFLKAGIMEVPDVLVVTKADLGPVATRALADLRAALRALGSARDRRCSRSPRSPPPSGIDELVDALDAHRAGLDLPGPAAARAGACTRWPTSSPSTASAACGPSAAGARPSAGSPSRTRAPTWPALDAGARGAGRADQDRAARRAARRRSRRRLRPWRDADLPALVAACQDPEIARWTRVPANYGETDARAYLLQRYDLAFAGRSAPFAIVGRRRRRRCSARSRCCASPGSTRAPRSGTGWRARPAARVTPRGRCG